MGRIVITEFVSLDGVREDPGGSERSKLGPWTFQFDRGAEGNQFKMDELAASDAMLLGRVTYEGFAKAWPGPTQSRGEETSDTSLRRLQWARPLAEKHETMASPRSNRGFESPDLASARCDGLTQVGRRSPEQSDISAGLLAGADS